MRQGDHSRDCGALRCIARYVFRKAGVELDRIDGEVGDILEAADRGPDSFEHDPHPALTQPGGTVVCGQSTDSNLGSTERPRDAFTFSPWPAGGWKTDSRA